MKRVMAIDYGLKRCGIAVTDPMQIIANGLDTVATKEITTWLEKYLASEIVETIVVGEPKQMDGTPSQIAKQVNAFATALHKKFPNVNIVRHDERFTSKMAFQTMIDGGLGKKQRRDKALIDKVSATILLQSYMEFAKGRL